MRGHRVLLGAMAVAAMGILTGAVSIVGSSPVQAQYYDDGYGPRGYDYGYDRPRFRGYGRRGGSICVTARGNCPYPPAPFNSPCGCDIPGFGLKRGQIGG